MNENAARPTHWPSPNDPLLVAARKLDAQVDAGTDLAAVTDELGLSLDTLTHLATQRAMRGLNLTTDDATFDMIAAAIIDGICIGWEAHQAVTS